MRKGVRILAGGTWLLLSFVAGGAVAVEVEGRLDWVRRAELGTLVSGVVAQVGAEPGERVAEGEVLVQLDQRTLQAAVNEAEARVGYLRRLYGEAERERERAQELYDRTLLSNHDLELAHIAFERAKAELREAEAALVRARQELEYSTIRAPFAATVLTLEVVPGQSVNTRFQSTPLVTVAGTERMKVRLWLDDAQLEGVQPGDQLAVQVGGQRFTGRVEYIGLEPSEGVRYPVEVVFESGRARLRAGERARVTLP